MYKKYVTFLLISLFSLFLLLFFPQINRAQPLGDYGDAPDGSNAHYPVPLGAPGITGNFPTQFSTLNSRVGQPGVHHLNTNQEWFGSGVSLEAGANDPLDPDGFPNLVNNDAFDDALPPVCFSLVLVSIPPQASVTFFVTVAPGAPNMTRYVNMLIDWDRSGDWKNIPGAAPEWALVNYPVNVPSGTTKAITAPIPWGLGAVLAPQIFWLRMTLSRATINQSQFATVGGWDGSGVFQYGETEDFLFHPSVPHSGPPPWNPPPPGWPPGWLPPNLPGIELVPKSQTVPHGWPAWVHIVLTPPGAPPPNNYGWAVDPGQRGGFLFDPGTGPGYLPPGGGYTAPGSGSTGTLGGLPLPIAVPPGTIDWITINSIVHPLVPPVESWPVRVKARWPGIRVQTRKAIVHIIHSGLGPFGIMGRFTFLFSTIESYDLPVDIKVYLISLVDESRNSFQIGNTIQAVEILNSILMQAPSLGLPPELIVELHNQINPLIQEILETGPVPVPEITGPEDGDIVKGVATVAETTLSPDITYNRFEYTADGNMWIEIGTDYDGSDGWSVDWDSTVVDDGIKLIRATMENAAGLQGTDYVYVWIDNTRPEPLIISPMEGEAVRGVLTIEAVTDPLEDDLECSFEISADELTWFEIAHDFDGEDGYTTNFNTDQLEKGDYIIRATMVDSAGNEGSALVVITISEPCPGDFDNDGDVDGSDLAVFVADFGRTDCCEPDVPICEGDFDDDCDVDGSDLAIFAVDFGRTDCTVYPGIE